MILSAIAERLKRQSKDDFKVRHFEAPLILQAVCWYRKRSLKRASRRWAIRPMIRVWLGMEMKCPLRN